MTQKALLCRRCQVPAKGEEVNGRLKHIFCPSCGTTMSYPDYLVLQRQEADRFRNEIIERQAGVVGYLPTQRKYAFFFKD